MGQSSLAVKKVLVEESIVFCLEEGSFVEAGAKKWRALGDQVWVQLTEAGVKARELHLTLCVVGKCGDRSNLEPWLPELRRWVDGSWVVRKKVKSFYLGGPLCCFEFEDEEDLALVLARGSTRFENTPRPSKMESKSRLLEERRVGERGVGEGDRSSFALVVLGVV